MTKILINAKVLMNLFSSNEEFEVELVKNASSQVAEAFKKKVDTGTMVGQMVASLEQQLSMRYSPLSKTVQEILAREAKVVLGIEMNNMAGSLIKDAVTKAMEGHKVWIQNNLNGIIIEKVTAAMRASQEAAVKGALI